MIEIEAWLDHEEVLVRGEGFYAYPEIGLALGPDEVWAVRKEDGTEFDLNAISAEQRGKLVAELTAQYRKERIEWEADCYD